MRASPHVSSICRHQQPSVSSSTPLLTAAEGRPAYAFCHTGGVAFMRQIIRVPAQQGWICQPGPLPQRRRHEAPAAHPAPAAVCPPLRHTSALLHGRFPPAGGCREQSCCPRCCCWSCQAAGRRQRCSRGGPRARLQGGGGKQERQGATRLSMASHALRPGFAQVSSFPCPDRSTVRHQLEPCTTPCPPAHPCWACRP